MMRLAKIHSALTPTLSPRERELEVRRVAR